MPKGALFLDRDGTINVDHVYINDPSKIELIPGAAGAIGRARRAGYLVVVVTNQSGVGRGLIEAEKLPRIHERMEELLQQEDPDARIDHYGICLHHPREECACRKPSPLLVLEAARELEIDLSRSAFMGDKLTDVAAGRNAGCRVSVLLRTGKGREEEKLLEKGAVAAEERPDWVAEDLSEGVSLFLERPL